jgi:hypothetical protein
LKKERLQVGFFSHLLSELLDHLAQLFRIRGGCHQRVSYAVGRCDDAAASIAVRFCRPSPSQCRYRYIAAC